MCNVKRQNPQIKQWIDIESIVLLFVNAQAIATGSVVMLKMMSPIASESKNVSIAIFEFLLLIMPINKQFDANVRTVAGIDNPEATVYCTGARHC